MKHWMRHTRVVPTVTYDRTMPLQHCLLLVLATSVVIMAYRIPSCIPSAEAERKVDHIPTYVLHTPASEINFETERHCERASVRLRLGRAFI